MTPSTPHRIFLLSPANAAGERARILLNDRAQFELALRLREEGAPLGEVYAFMSGLYFRGKIAYSKAFATPPSGMPGALVITPGRGLVPPDTPVTVEDLRAIATVRIDLDDPLYRAPLERDAQRLDQAAGQDCLYVLLGSLATPKYTEPLLKIFGERLLFPSEFVGRGDMSRGGLMLRRAHDRIELDYVPAHSATRHGSRPPKLPKWKPGIPASGSLKKP
jgi:hypothetical protein